MLQSSPTLGTQHDNSVFVCVCVLSIILYIVMYSCSSVEKAILQIRNISKLYAHLHRLIRVRPLVDQSFHYEVYLHECHTPRPMPTPLSASTRAGSVMVNLFGQCFVSCPAKMKSQLREVKGQTWPSSHSGTSAITRRVT